MKLARWSDRIGFALAAAFALPTITYPLGRDLALFLYIGRQWLHGALPYRDVYDFKPPGIFAVNALTVAVFGQAQWPVHVVDIAAILAMSYVVSLAVVRDRPRARGEMGAVALVTAGFYYCTFDFIELAQTELFESLALIGAYAVAVHARRARAAFAVGLLVGLAITFKPTALVLGLVPMAAVCIRFARAGDSRWLAATRAFGAFLLGGAIVGAIVIGAFAALGGLDAMIEMLVRHVWDYHAHASFAPVTREWFLTKLRREPWTFVFAACWVFAIVSSVRRRAWGAVAGASAALAFVALAFASIVYQRRFLGYYWVVMTPFLALAAAQAFAEIRRPLAAPAVACVAVALGLAIPQALPRPYPEMIARFWGYARGHLGRAQYLEPFEEYAGEERLGDMIRSRARPGDALMVRGYEPAVYVVSGLSCPSRFAVEIPFVTPGMTYKRDEWRDEHERDVWGNHVRFAVTFADAVWDHDAIRARGYHEIARDGFQVLFERND